MRPLRHIGLLLVICYFFIRCHALEADCVLNRAGDEAVTFTGVLQSLSTDITHTQVTIRVDRVNNDPKGLLRIVDGRVQARLPSSKCISVIRTGENAVWTGSNQWMNNQLVFVVRLLRSEYSADERQLTETDQCATKRCHQEAVCEAWNDGFRTRVAVCTCLGLQDLANRGRCQLNRGEVCATNGKLYASPCAMLHDACLQQMNLEVVSWTAVNEMDCTQQANQAERRLLPSKTGAEQTPQPPSKAEVKWVEEPPVDQPQHDAAIPSGQSVFRNEINHPDCSLECSQAQVQPVCGNDGKTYLNQCLLRQRECMADKQTGDSMQIKLQHRGYCPVPPPEIEPTFCDHANYCQFGAWCKTHTIPSQYPLRYSNDIAAAMSRQGGGSMCSCEHIRCHTSWLHQQKQQQPLCGDDGVTYAGECFLKKAACLEQSSKLKLHDGPCKTSTEDPCETVNCSPGFICRLNEERRPICQCGGLGDCNSTATPICANDGRTYPNICVMREAACHKDQKLRALTYQNCVAGLNPCLGHGCTWPGEQCRVDIQGRKSCICPERCPPIVVPVCGSDGTTYDSICDLQRVACLKKQHIWVVYAGQCTASSNACERRGQHCRGFEICTHETLQTNRDSALNYAAPVPKCSCPFCPEGGLGGKVCGTDGRTYSSECSLRNMACQTGRLQLKVAQRGSCDACKYNMCKFYSICQTDEAGEAFCACPTNCLMVNKPVCGSDGRTYNNECLLKVHACAVQREIHVVDTKMCDSCSKPCPLGMRCLGGECICRESCPKSGFPGDVCGTDGRLYPSVCELRRQACINKVTVKVDGSGIGCSRSKEQSSSVADEKNDLQADGVLENDCGCNKIGSRDNFCDQRGRCRCHWGVEGTKCDQCTAGYWGISNGKSCVSCSCNRFGAVNINHCDSHSGECKCKPGIHGQQCHICPNGEPVTENGCSETKTKNMGVVDLPKPTLYADKTEPVRTGGGAHFTAMAAASIPISWPVRPPFTLTLNFTPSATIRDGNLALMTTPQLPGQPHQQVFLRLVISVGHLKLSYVSDLASGKIKHLEFREILKPQAYSISATVTANNGLVLRVSTPGGSNSEEGSNSRLLRADEYSDLLNNRNGALVIGCLSIKGRRNTSCGFAGCLSGASLSYIRNDGQLHEEVLFANEKHINWIEPPEDGVRQCSAEDRLIATNAEDDPINENRDPCKNDGRREKKGDGSFGRCVCQPGWQGQFCDKEATVVPEFNGKAFVRLTGPGGSDALKKRRIKMELTFLRKKEDGIIFAIPPIQTGSEFIAIRAEADGCVKVYLRVGRILQLSGHYFYKWLLTHYNDGKRLTISKICSITDNQWHTLTIDKKSNAFQVFLDEKLAADVVLFPQGLPKSKLRKSLTSFDLSQSPVYLGGLPAEEGRFVEDAVPSKQFFVGAIQKVVINGAELVLAGPPIAPSVAGKTGNPSSSSPLEHWEGAVQWQGPPCGDNYSTCGTHPNSLERVCRPLGDRHECSCSTPLNHMLFVNQLTVKKGWSSLKDVASQRAISIEAERMACDAVAATHGLRAKDLQADVPNKDEESVKTFTRTEERHPVPPLSPQDVATRFHPAVQFSGQTVLKYANFVPDAGIINNLRIKLKTSSPDGLLLLIPEKDIAPDEFLALALSGGRPELYLSLHGSPSTIYTDQRKMFHLKSAPYVADGAWHNIQLLREKGQTTLIVDNQMVSGHFVGTDGILNSKGDIWLGGSLRGIPDLSWQYQRNFTGCIAAFFSNENLVDLLQRAELFYGTINACS